MPEIYHDVVKIKCLKNFRLGLTFDDGKSGILDCIPFIVKGGVFSVLQDPNVFNQAKIHKSLASLHGTTKLTSHLKQPIALQQEQDYLNGWKRAKIVFKEIML